jgi:hypothetical protein
MDVTHSAERETEESTMYSFIREGENYESYCKSIIFTKRHPQDRGQYVAEIEADIVCSPDASVRVVKSDETRRYTVRASLSFAAANNWEQITMIDGDEHDCALLVESLIKRDRGEAF